jgi:uncharacterized membrane protein
MSLPRVMLALTAVGFLGFGLAFTFRPDQMAALIEIGLPSATARVDFAATYGGFELGFGAFLLLCARRPGWQEAGLLAATLALAGFATVRLLGIAASGGQVRPAIYGALALETLGVLLNGWALLNVRKSRS